MVYSDTDEYIIEKTEKHLRKIRIIIKKKIAKKSFEKALALIATAGTIQYGFNQRYIDGELEEDLKCISKNLQRILGDLPLKKDQRMLLFFDGFGTDSRGLAYIYVDALIKIGFDVVYVSRRKRASHIKHITDRLSEAGASVVFLEERGYLKTAQELAELRKTFAFSKAILYIPPADVSAILAFEAWEGIIERYYINLTDHAFWLGIGAFDYLIDFRSYGTYISNHFRKVGKDRILLQPFYPCDFRTTEFGELPFRKRSDQFTIFSGGALYKTIDINNTYYNIIEFIMRHYPQVIFWYAGEMDIRYIANMERLMKKYPNRFFFTEERNDLASLLKQVDLYFSTYPISGGLMTQYAAKAGVIPLTLVCDKGDSSGILLNQTELQCDFYTEDDILMEISKLVNDSEYRRKKEKLLEHAVISECEFADNLSLILSDHESKYESNNEEYDTNSFRRKYVKRFGKHGFEEIYSSPTYLKNVTITPFLYIYYMLKSGKIARVIRRFLFLQRFLK